MKTPRIIVNLALIAAFAVCVVGISVVQRELDELKQEHELVVQGNATNLTPTMAFTTGALGAFRGLIADVLFLRMEYLKEQEKYFEINELGHLIVQLQPDMPQAIAFIAWNMAYNISVKFTSPRDRWRWVQRGIEVIRDHAVEQNIRDPLVYHQLSWLYQHKVGHMLDDANKYYKGQLALQMIQVLSFQEHYDWDLLAAAPHSRDELQVYFADRMMGRMLLDDPDASPAKTAKELLKVAADYRKKRKLAPGMEEKLSTPQVREIVLRVISKYRDVEDREKVEKAYMGARVFIGAEARFFDLLRKNEISYERFEFLFRERGEKRPFGGIPEQYKDDVAELGLTEMLDRHFRVRWLKQELKIDAREVAKMNKKYGYLDMRLPEGHAIYWAEQGLHFSPKNVKLTRSISQNLRKGSQYGLLRHITPEGYPVVMPNFESIDPCIDWYESLEHPSQGDTSGHVYFMMDTIVICYTWGEDELAQKYFKYLRDSGLRNTEQLKNQTVDQFALNAMSQDVKDRSEKQTNAMMFGLAVRYVESVAYDEPDRAERLLQLLNRVYKVYHSATKSKRMGKRIQILSPQQAIVEAKIYSVESAATPSLAGLFRSVRPDLNDAVRQRLQKRDEERRKMMPKLQKH